MQTIKDYFFYVPFDKITFSHPTPLEVLNTAPKLPLSLILSHITVMGKLSAAGLYAVISGILKTPKKRQNFNITNKYPQLSAIYKRLAIFLTVKI